MTLAGIGLAGLALGDFNVIWRPVPKAWPAREALVYGCAIVSLGCGLGLLWRRTAVVAAATLTLWLLLWLAVFKAHAVVAAPLAAVGWESVGETGVLAAAAGALFGQGAGRGLGVARALFGLCLGVFGVAHLAYVALTARLVPHWAPWPTAWVYATGATYIAAGVAIVVDRVAKPAAALAAVQIGLFTLLVWLPAVSTGRASADQRGELTISWVLTAAAWTVADTYRAGRRPPSRR